MSYVLNAYLKLIKPKGILYFTILRPLAQAYNQR